MDIRENEVWEKSCNNEFRDKFRMDDQFISTDFDFEYKWEGVITNIDGETITARLIESLTEEEDELQINIKDISPDDRGLVDVGALFNLYTGYDYENGIRTNTNRIKFRRRLSVNEKDLDDVLDTMIDFDFDNLFVEH